MDSQRISACTYPLRELDLDTTFAAFARAGCRRLDLWGRPPHFSTDPSQVSPDEIERLARQHGVRIANLGAYPGQHFLAEDPAVRAQAREEMRQSIDLAQRFGARSIRVMPGSGDGPALAETLVDPFREAAEYAQARGIHLGMENHAGSIAGNPELARQLCEGVGSRHFGVLYEPCNLLHGHCDYREAFETFHDWIVHVHVKDGAWIGDRFERRHLGEGDVDCRWLITALEGIGYEGDYALEYEICDIEPLETGLPRWLEYFRSL